MNKERYNQIIDEVYENYKSTTLESDMKKSAWELTVQSMSGKKFIISQEEFINKCKTDTEFSEKWGLKIYTKVDGDKVWMGMVYNDNAVEIRLK